MSEIRATTISDAAGTGPIALTKQYTHKMWIAINGKNTISIRGSENVSSATENGIGDYTANITNALSSSNYMLSTGITEYAPSNPGGGNLHLRSNSGTYGDAPDLSTTAVRVELGESGGTNYDYAYVSWGVVV